MISVIGCNFALVSFIMNFCMNTAACRPVMGLESRQSQQALINTPGLSSADRYIHRIITTAGYIFEKADVYSVGSFQVDAGNAGVITRRMNPPCGNCSIPVRQYYASS